MIGQMVMVGFRGLYVAPHDPIADDIRSGRVGGVILFNRDVKRKSNYRNILRPGQVEKLTQSLQQLAPTPLFIAVDQEGGRVNRFKEKKRISHHTVSPNPWPTRYAEVDTP